jgi:hypothetical protein
MNLILIDKVNSNQLPFSDKVRFISSRLGINPDWLMAVMFLESSLNHRALNPQSGAVGLIQFMPNTCKAFGLTTDNFLAMSNVDQLQYVWEYLKPYQSKMKSFVDCYLAVFFPRAIGRDSDFVIETKRLPAQLIAKQNAGYDLNGDFRITKGEIERAITNRLTKYRTALC